ncbi:hypothetical protein AAFF_G00317520, partial [Aldrovandia affinis]
FNPWTIKWTNYTHGLTFSGTLRTAACWCLLKPGSTLRYRTRLLLRLDFPSTGRTELRSQSGKRRGGGVCIMVNSRWGSDIAVITKHCSPALELLAVKVRPFYLPREFSSAIITAVYIPPQADKTRALEDLYGVINGLEKAHPEAASIVVGDFNRANMRKVLPKYHQHINFPTRGEQTLDHCYSQ